MKSRGGQCSPLLLGLFACHLVDLSWTVPVGDGGCQLDVLATVRSGVSCKIVIYCTCQEQSDLSQIIPKATEWLRCSGHTRCKSVTSTYH